MRFSDLPDDDRMRLRGILEAAGGDVVGYHGDSVQVALPRPSSPVFAAAEACGLELVPASLHHFPLGSDRAPDNMRHDGRYPGSRGFWLYANFRLTAEAARPWTLEEVMRNEG